MSKPFALLCTLLTLLITLALLSACNISPAAADAPPVTAIDDGAKIVMDNGTVTLEILKAKSEIISVKYRHQGETTEMCKTMYYSASAGPTDRNAPRPPAGSIQIRQNQPTHLVRSGPDSAEVVMENGPTPTYPFHTETHYVLPRGESGYYAYQFYSHPADQPAATIGEARFVLKGPPGPTLYTTHVIDALRMMPYSVSPTVRAVSDATYLLQDGSIYTKYDNTVFMADAKGEHHVHGMTGHGVGIWMVNASSEYINGGPVKQELTVHSDNTLLNMLQGAHFGSGVLNFTAGEVWTKCYGPFLVYLNNGASTEAMYKDALRRADNEIAKWPYAWASGPNYPTARGTVQGQIRLATNLPTKATAPGENNSSSKRTNSSANARTEGIAGTLSVSSVEGAWAILAAPGGDWPLQGKGYEFYTRVGRDGKFTMPKVRPGAYTLYVYGANQFEQFVHDDVKVEADHTTDLGLLNWNPVTHGKTLWQIGTADRGTMEFHDGDNVRHFANYLRYAKDFPDDVTFTVGKSHEKTDWNYAQWTWYIKKPYWTIAFDLPAGSAPTSGKATLTMGIAASVPLHGRTTNLRITVNGQEVDVLHLEKSGPATYRSGGQDSLYRVSYVTFDAKLLKAGANTITLGHTDAQPLPTPAEQEQGKVGAVMYDAIRLEVEDQKVEDQKVASPSDKPDPHLPNLFIIGDSTVKNHTKGLQGWGDPIANEFDLTKINVSNHALGGRSSRTFLTEGLWEKTLAMVKPGDFVLMQFGHNDGGSLTTSYRASIKGNGEETQEVTDAKTGKKEGVHTYGWYLRKYISDTKAKGATPIVLSPVPRNIWPDAHTVARAANDYGKWAAEAAKAQEVPFVDLNEIIAKHYEALGPEKVKADFFPGDHTHTNTAGAILNAASVVEGLRALNNCKLVPFLRDKFSP